MKTESLFCFLLLILSVFSFTGCMSAGIMESGSMTKFGTCNYTSTSEELLNTLKTIEFSEDFSQFMVIFYPDDFTFQHWFFYKEQSLLMTGIKDRTVKIDLETCEKQEILYDSSDADTIDYREVLTDMHPLPLIMITDRFTNYKHNDRVLVHIQEYVSVNPPFFVHVEVYPEGGIRLSLLLAKTVDLLQSVVRDEYTYRDHGFSIFTGLDREGYDRDGYNIEGLNRFGYNREGYTPDGDRYAGDLEDGKRTGYGIYAWKDGRVYSGRYRADRRSGWGMMKETDGTVYVGYWAGDEKHGPGIFYTTDGHTELQTWENGSVVSSDEVELGKILSPPGDWVFLSTAVKGGLAHGEGSAVSLNGAREIIGGVFRDGRLIRGSLKEEDGSVYTGDFERGYLVRGEILTAEGSKYTGSLYEGVPNGRGTMVFGDGTEYEGTFSDGRFDGNGKLTRASGEVYEGPFVNGLPHGLGIFKQGGTVERCEYYEGQRIDQAYLIRVENEKREAERLRREMAEEEARRLAEEEAKKRAEEEARLAAAREQARLEAERNKRAAAIGIGLLGGVLGSSAGMSGGEAVLFGASVTADVMDGTSGTHMREASDTIIAVREAGSAAPVPSTSATERASDFSAYGSPPVKQRQESVSQQTAVPPAGTVSSREESTAPAGSPAPGLPACVYVWRTESGKYRAHGPVQKILVACETEEEAFGLAAGQGPRSIVRTIPHPMPGYPDGTIYILSDPPLESYEENVAEIYGFTSLLPKR